MTKAKAPGLTEIRSAIEYVKMEEDREWLTPRYFFSVYGFEPNDKDHIKMLRAMILRKGF
jgi:hypothetical protein